MARFSRPRTVSRSVASALAREQQVSSARTARTRSLSRDVVVAPSVQEDAWSRAVEWGQVPAADPSPPEPGSSSLPASRRSPLSDTPSQPMPPAYWCGHCTGLSSRGAPRVGVRVCLSVVPAKLVFTISLRVVVAIVIVIVHCACRQCDGRARVPRGALGLGEVYKPDAHASPRRSD